MTSPLVTPTVGSLIDEMPWLHEGVGDQKSKVVVEEKEDVLDDTEPVGRVTPRPTSIPIPPPSANLSALLSPLPISPMPGNPDREGPGSPTVSSSPETAMRAMTSPMPMLGNFMGESGETAAMMGTSPPFSSLLGAGIANSGFGWAQRLGSNAQSKEDGKKEDDDDKTVAADGDVTPMPMPDVNSGVLPSKLLANIREKSTSVPGGSGGRRPGSPMGSGKSSPVRAPSPPSDEKSKLSLVVDGTQAKAGSGSDSGSSATARSGSGGSGSSGSGHRKRHHRHDPQGLGLTFKSPTSPTASPATSSFSSSLTSSRRQAPGVLSPLNGLSAPPVPFASPVSPGGPTSVAGRNSVDDIRDPDSIYQAFVKQWCFASGPAPAQAGGFGTMSGTGDKKGL